MADEPEPLENLVARRIREQLGEGGLDRLIQAQQAVQKSIALQVPAATAHASMPAPTVTVTGGMAAQLQPMQVAINVQPVITAEVDVIPRKVVDDAVDAIRAVDPGLANEIQGRSPQDAMLLINLFMALMQVVQTALLVYQILHPQPVTPTQIVEIFNQTTNYVITNPPR